MNASVSSEPTQSIAAFEESACVIAGTENIRVAVAADCVAGVQPKLIVEPATETELAKLLKLANDAGLAVVPRGGGTKLAWGNPPQRADIVLSTARLNAIVEHAHSDLTVTVEAGCTIQLLSETLAQHNQRLALDALWPGRATVGGILSTNDNGALRLRFGSLRDLVIGITLVLPDGTIAKSGGRVVKNVAGYDLPKLVTGALGTLGIITQATFRLHPAPQNAQTISCVVRDARETQRLLLLIQDSKLAHSALQVRFVESMSPQLDVLFEATEAGCSAQIEQVKKLLAPASIIDSGPAVWKTRQELYSEATANNANSALAKLSVLPTQISDTHEALTTIAAVNRVRFNAVVQATGLGSVYFAGQPNDIAATLKQIRARIEALGGSLVIAHRPDATSGPGAWEFDAWGNAGDALPLMRAVKKQFDPKSTLNPGRFVGGV
jgi:glycolate oxidase FAD binding subunit